MQTISRIPLDFSDSKNRLNVADSFCLTGIMFVQGLPLASVDFHTGLEFCSLSLGSGKFSPLMGVVGESVKVPPYSNAASILSAKKGTSNNLKSVRPEVSKGLVG